MAAGEDLYHLDARVPSRKLDADLVVTQDLCAVPPSTWARSTMRSTTSAAAPRSSSSTRTPSTRCSAPSPPSALATGTEGTAARLVADCSDGFRGWRNRCGAASPACAGPRVDRPTFAPGHWVPEMVTAAGGSNALGMPAEKSARATWDAVRASAPDIIVAAPCGYHLDGAGVALAQKVIIDGNLPHGIPVWAVDANASFARPRPRLVDGVEAFAASSTLRTAKAPEPRWPGASAVGCLRSVDQRGKRSARVRRPQACRPRPP